MQMPTNLTEMMGMIRGGGNPQQFVMNMLQQNSQNNPLMQNILQMAKNNDTKGIEEMARNITKERGKDFDTEFKNFKQMFGF